MDGELISLSRVLCARDAPAPTESRETVYINISFSCYTSYVYHNCMKKMKTKKKEMKYFLLPPL